MRPTSSEDKCCCECWRWWEDSEPIGCAAIATNSHGETETASTSSARTHTSTHTNTDAYIHSHRCTHIHTCTYSNKSPLSIPLPLEGTCRTYRNPRPTARRNDERTGTYFIEVYPPRTVQATSRHTVLCHTVQCSGNYITISPYIHFLIDCVDSFFDTPQICHTAVNHCRNYSAMQCSTLH